MRPRVAASGAGLSQVRCIAGVAVAAQDAKNARGSATRTPCSVEPLDQAGRRDVVHDRERAQVVGADRQHPAVVVAALLLDGPGVPRDVGEVLAGGVVELLQVEHDLVGGLVAGRRCRRAAAPTTGTR